MLRLVGAFPICGVEGSGLCLSDSSDQRERTNNYRAAARFVSGTATCGVEDLHRPTEPVAQALNISQAHLPGIAPFSLRLSGSLRLADSRRVLRVLVAADKSEKSSIDLDDGHDPADDAEEVGEEP